MSNQVYANNMSVSCKAAAGKSICAFPDVCMTPPQTPATPPGVPIPYPNTGLASDTSDGSTSVNISGQEVMLKNKSYFKKSTGDEAGCAPMKGVITHTNMGKVYFNAWSMDVKVEGENVVRMMDMTTHNHASLPGNSPAWPYIDEAAFSGTGVCKDVAKQITEKCPQKPDKKDRKAWVKAMCDNPDSGCRDAMKCVLSPHSPRAEHEDGTVTQGNCCPGKTPHHVVPAHCFMPPGERAGRGDARYSGCEGYSPAEAPCICVEGAGKEKDHGEIHKRVDKAEDKFLLDGQAGSWTYKQASTAGSRAVSKVTKCDEACIKAQVDAYHQQNDGTPNVKDDTKLRADSSGNRTLSDQVPSVTEVGTNF
jgi:hypothetical protein